MRRFLLGLALVGFMAPTSHAQSVSLVETSEVGTGTHLQITTRVSGKLRVTRDGKAAEVPVEAKSEHTFTERVLGVERSGLTRKTVRQYDRAIARVAIDGQSSDRTLSAERRLVVAQRTEDGYLCYALAGPLAQSEVEVVNEHFDSLHVVGLLPQRAVEVGSSWKIDAIATQSLCLFDGLISHELNGKLESVADGKAKVVVRGSAKGVEHGAMVTLQIEADLTYDVSSKRITHIEWRQKDLREQGPVTPAGELSSTTTVVREPRTTFPDSIASARVPEGEPAAGLKYVAHTGPGGKFRLLLDRGWRVVGQTDYHLIIRFLDRGDFVAQATLTPWQNAGPGKHISPLELEKVVAQGWKMEQVLDRGEVATDSDRWLYRITARGELDGAPVVQSFLVLANADGEQAIVTFTMKPANASRLGTRDVAVVNAIDFAKK